MKSALELQNLKKVYTRAGVEVGNLLFRLRNPDFKQVLRIIEKIFCACILDAVLRSI